MLWLRGSEASFDSPEEVLCASQPRVDFVGVTRILHFALEGLGLVKVPICTSHYGTAYTHFSFYDGAGMVRGGEGEGITNKA